MNASIKRRRPVPGATNLRARLDRVTPASSAGLARLQQANRIEVQRRSAAARDELQSQSEAGRRQGLFDAAVRSLVAISDVVLRAIADAAPTAELRRGRDGGWSVALGSVELAVAPAALPGPWDQSAVSFDVVAVSRIDLHLPATSNGYEGRSHSLWFGDVQTADQYLWYETAFHLSPVLARVSSRDPFALDPGSDAALALSPAMHTHQVAWPFTPLQVDDLADFVDRWADWLAVAAEGSLLRSSSMPERDPTGSWRRG